MKVKIMTYNGTEFVTVKEGDTVRVHPDTRGTFLPVLRDELCKAIVVENRGTKKRPDVWVLCRAIEPRYINGNPTPAHAERWLGIADLEVLQ